MITSTSRTNRVLAHFVDSLIGALIIVAINMGLNIENRYLIEPINDINLLSLTVGDCISIGWLVCYFVILPLV